MVLQQIMLLHSWAVEQKNESDCGGMRYLRRWLYDPMLKYALWTEARGMACAAPSSGHVGLAESLIHSPWVGGVVL